MITLEPKQKEILPGLIALLAQCRRAGLSAQSALALLCIVEQRGRIYQSELMARLECDELMAFSLLHALDRAGLGRFLPNPEDASNAHLELTEEGRTEALCLIGAARFV